MLDSSSLVEHPDNEYLFGMEGIERLAEGMRKVVWDMKDGSFLIYSGARRNRANMLLGNTRIKAFVYPYPESETERRREFLGANIYGRNAVQRDNAIYTARQISYLRETIQMERENGIYEVQELVDYIKAHEGEPLTAEDAVNFVCDARVFMDASNISKMNANSDISREGQEKIQKTAQVDGTWEDRGVSADEDMGSAQGILSEKSTTPFYTPKVAVKKFNQYYGKIEEFLRADKQYKEKDREDVLRKLQQLRELIDSEISRVGKEEAEGEKNL